MTGETLHTSTVNWTGHGSSLHSIESEDAYPGNGIYGEEQSEPETNDGNETGSDGESPEDPQ
ncbi:hypothetical protein [Sneathiella sp.]|jgi:hypothetical protein|uniref:hypothetical protein n=1 Tax=Sneathiella sp. TaxID=1964365 RepID=UPI0039E4B3BA